MMMMTNHIHPAIDNSQQQSPQSIADYLAQLLKDRKQLAALPNVFTHLERLLDEEIARVRASLFQINGVRKEPLQLPEPDGETVTLNEKVYVPVKEHPDFNFVGRILGPRGMTAKQLEQETGCKIMVRGKGSMRDKKKEDANRGKPNWEHLADDLHVLITVEDTENRAKLKLQRAVEEVQKLLVPQAEGEDELKKRQLMELAIINGTYRDSSTKAAAAACEEEWRRLAQSAAENRLLSPGMQQIPNQMRATQGTPLGSIFQTDVNLLAYVHKLHSEPTFTGAPLILSPRMSVPTTGASLLSSQPTLDHSGLIYAAAPFTDYTNYAALAAAGNPLLTDYADHTGGLFAR
ncbi:hypothetical protein ACKWTF_012204 [Chironomus riparius]